jgi:hypothetical protein
MGSLFDVDSHETDPDPALWTPEPIPGAWACLIDNLVCKLPAAEVVERIGRTLEHVVYELSRAWGVNVNRTALQILSDLDNSFEQLSRAVIDYATTDEDEKAGRQKSVFRQYQIVSSKLTRLVLDLDSDICPRSADVPVNVELIVRDIRKQFVRRNKVSNAVNSIINENILTKIMDIRNDAEHASTSGERRELSKSEIDAAVELLRTALFRFCNVAFAIAEKER